MMFPVDQTSRSQQITQPVKQPIRTYIRIFPAAGIDPVRSEQYQIIDGNSLLNKKQPSNLIIHPFSYVFNTQFDSSKMIQHMNLINDAFDGHNQYVINEIEKSNMMGFIIGNLTIKCRHCGRPGFIVQLGTQLFYEAHYHRLKTQKALKSKNINTQQKLGFSVFCTEEHSNKFLDLVIGQKLVYYSKKDMDEYKTFYTKQITDLRQFLILLKISLVHYRQRCREGDPIIFKFSIYSYDEINHRNYQSTLEVVIIQRNSKLASSITKKIQSSLDGVHTKGQDHGSLANYIQRDLKKNRLIYLYGIPYRNNIMVESVPKFNFMGRLRSNNTHVPRNWILQSHQQLIENLRSYAIPKYFINTSNLNLREVSSIANLLNKMLDFVNDTGIKWKNYCSTIMEILNTQEQFYEKQRFPVGLEIKDDNIKTFMISKVYKLSETFQIQDLTLQFEKLRTIKNQIMISLKALLSTPKQSSNNINPGPSLHSSSPQQPSAKSSNSKPITKFLQQFYYKILQEYKQNLKIMFSFSYKKIKFYNLQLLDISDMFDIRNIKNIIKKLKQQETGGPKTNERDQRIMLRKIKYEEQVEEDLDISRSMYCSRVAQGLDQSMNKYDIKLGNKGHKKLYSQNIQCEIKKSKINKNYLNYQSNRNNYPSVLSNYSSAINKEDLQNNSSLTLLKPSKNKENSYNFSLPRIAVIHHPKKRIL